MMKHDWQGGRDPRPKHRFNWFDRTVVVLLVIGLVCGGVAIWHAVRREDGDTGEISYTLVLSDMEACSLSVGSTVRSQNGTAELGEVVDVRRNAHTVAAVADGVLVLSEVADRFDYTLTVRSTAHKKAGDGIRIGDIRIAAGMTVTLRIGDFYATRADVIAVNWEAAYE